MIPLALLVVTALPAFLASTVEFVEAFTIVLAVGNTRGWRAPVWGIVAGITSLGVIIVVAGAPLLVYQEAVGHKFQLVVGILLLLFGTRWLRKAILRFAGLIALHDEGVIYRRELAELRGLTRQVGAWDHVGFWLSYQPVLMEGLEVAFIILALGAQSPAALSAATIGAVAAFVVVLGAVAIIRRPLTMVPENWMKFAVGVIATSYGIFWTGEGLGVDWAWNIGSLPLLISAVSMVSWVALRMLMSLTRQPARANVDVATAETVRIGGVEG